MNNRGAYLVLLLLAAGLVAASVAVWHQHRQTRQALALWGPAVASRIERAAKVELIELGKAGGGDAEPTGDARQRGATNISHARGLLHFRRSLLQDANFDWEAALPGASDDDWDYAVRFSDDEGSVTLIFDLDQGLVANRAPRSGVAQLTQKMSEGVGLFFEETAAAAE